MKKRTGLTLAFALAWLAGAAIGQETECDDNLIRVNPSAAYTVDGALVTDNRTGLMWKRCAEGQTLNMDGTGCEGTATTHNWSQALLVAASSSFGGHQDWRLPNVKELFSLVETCRRNPAIHTEIFPDTPAETFWSGSPSGRFDGRAWPVNFNSGSTTSFSFVTNLAHVRLVRNPS